MRTKRDGRARGQRTEIENATVAEIFREAGEEIHLQAEHGTTDENNDPT